MDYRSAAEARDLAGLRLALTVGVPGPWGESAKKVFEYKGIPYVPVAQYASRANEDLVSWTGIRNAPVAVYENEAPRSNFQDIVALAERLQPEPRLVPMDPVERQVCLGISADICGEGGFGWKRRILMSQRPRDDDPPDLEDPGLDRKVMGQAYRHSADEAALALDYVAGLLDELAARLKRQRLLDSPYFVGNAVTACDIHWACFSALLEPLPHDVNPMPDWLRLSYGYLGPLAPHRHQILIDHRDHMFAAHLGLPLDF